MSPSLVDLRSDTVTRPTAAMRRAMAEAEVGDDVYGEDPTVNRLQARVAALTGKEAALFLPSGTMANQAALIAHTRPGDEVILEAGAHIRLYEGGGMAANAGVQPWPLAGERGLLDPAAVAAAIRPDDPHDPATSLICVEDTSNRGGGTIYPLAVIDALGALARARGLRLHMDGARAWNAAVGSGLPLARRVAACDSVSLCLSKGLGAPVGSVLCGSADFIRRANRARKRLGGGMRQAGVLAAAGLYALDHHVARLAEDHARAARLAEGLAALPGARLRAPPQSNLIYLEVDDAPRWVSGLKARGVLVGEVGPTLIRLVTHLDVHDAGIDRALEAAAALGAAR